MRWTPRRPATQVEDLEAALARRTGTTGDAFAMVVDGETV